MVNATRTDWSTRLDDALWSHREAYKTTIGMSLYHIVYGKTFILPVDLEHKDMWATKKLKMDLNEAVEQRFNGLNEIDEFRFKAYESSTIQRKDEEVP